MKKALTLLIMIFSFSLFGQTTIKITTKKHVPRKGIYLRLKTVFDDSRCPEGVTCVWAGEVSATIEVYKGKKIIEENTLTFNSKNRVENLKWFAKYFSNKIKSISILPFPKEGKKINPNNQYIEISCEN